jgi:hypothetical protein
MTSYSGTAPINRAQRADRRDRGRLIGGRPVLLDESCHGRRRNADALRQMPVHMRNNIMTVATILVDASNVALGTTGNPSRPRLLPARPSPARSALTRPRPARPIRCRPLRTSPHAPRQLPGRPTRTPMRSAMRLPIRHQPRPRAALPSPARPRVWRLRHDYRCGDFGQRRTDYNGEIWIFDQAVTATNDNAALSVSDANIQFLVGVIPFRTNDTNAANSISYVTGLEYRVYLRRHGQSAVSGEAPQCCDARRAGSALRPHQGPELTLRWLTKSLRTFRQRNKPPK